LIRHTSTWFGYTHHKSLSTRSLVFRIFSRGFPCCLPWRNAVRLIQEYCTTYGNLLSYFKFFMSSGASASKELSLILHNIRSAHNVGSIFRTADAAGVFHIYLAGYTPAPVDRFNRENSKISKVALGAEKNVPWSCHEKTEGLIAELEKEGYFIIALEQDKNSKDYKKVTLKRKNVLILGEETSGIERNILDSCDLIAEIPMIGAKESLNVSVAAGIAVFRMIDG